MASEASNISGASEALQFDSFERFTDELCGWNISGMRRERIIEE